MKTVAYILCGAAVLGYLLSLRRCARPARSFIKSALGGVASLMAINLLSGFTTVGIAVNLVTVGFSVLFGVVGTIFMLVVRLL